MPDRLVHLLIGAAIIAAYFAATPGHLWQPAPLFVVDPEQSLSESGDWQQGALSWPDQGLAGQPVLSRTAAGLQAYWSSNQPRPAVYQAQPGSDQAPQPLFNAAQLSALLGQPLAVFGQVLPLPGQRAGADLLLLEADQQLWLLAVDLDQAGQPDSLVWARALRFSPFSAGQLRLGPQVLQYRDGSVAVALYYTDRGAQLLRFSPVKGQILSRTQLTGQAVHAAPLLFVDSGQAAAALLGDGEQGHWLASNDAGQQWQRLPYSPHPWPLASGVGLRLQAGHWLAALPCVAADKTLAVCLQQSHDYGEHWQPLQRFVAETVAGSGASSAASLPMALAGDGQGGVHLLYPHAQRGWQYARYRPRQSPAATGAHQ